MITLRSGQKSVRSETAKSLKKTETITQFKIVLDMLKGLSGLHEIYQIIICELRRYRHCLLDSYNDGRRLRQT